MPLTQMPNRAPKRCLKIVVAVFLSALFTLSKAYALDETPRSAELPPKCGRLEMSRCDAELKLAETGLTVPLKPRQEICPGDIVSTGARSNARWLMKNGDAIELLPDSRAALLKETKAADAQPLPPARWRLERGGLIVTRVQHAHDPQPPMSKLEIVFEDGRALIEGPRALVRLRPDGQIKAIAFKGEIKLRTSGGKEETLAEASQVDGGSRSALSAEKLREAEVAVHDWPEKFDPENESSPKHSIESNCVVDPDASF